MLAGSPCLSAEMPDGQRTRAAARHVAGRIAGARMGAINVHERSAFGSSRLVDYSSRRMSMATERCRALDIQSASICRSPRPPLGFDFRNVHFGLAVGILIQTVPEYATDGVRIGTARILTMSPDGTASHLYVSVRRSAIRVLGATGRTRV